jgi:radical SAM superfamily enzyme YgiQ (UPF0313 family)
MVKVIVGGPHVTALPEETLQNACFDIGVIGEGETTILDLVERRGGSIEILHVHTLSTWTLCLSLLEICFPRLMHVVQPDGLTDACHNRLLTNKGGQGIQIVRILH